MLEQGDVLPFGGRTVLRFDHLNSFSDMLAGAFHLYKVLIAIISSKKFIATIYPFPHFWVCDPTNDSSREETNCKNL